MSERVPDSEVNDYCHREMEEKWQFGRAMGWEQCAKEVAALAGDLLFRGHDAAAIDVRNLSLSLMRSAEFIRENERARVSR